jgi:hypothetical protein
MIRYSIADLRQPTWECANQNDLLRRIRSDHRNSWIEWTITPWQRSGGPNPHRSYLLHATDGAIYAIFFRKI